MPLMLWAPFPSDCFNETQPSDKTLITCKSLNVTEIHPSIIWPTRAIVCSFIAPNDDRKKKIKRRVIHAPNIQASYWENTRDENNHHVPACRMSSRCSLSSIPISFRLSSSMFTKSVSTSNPFILNIPAYSVNPRGPRNFPIPKSFIAAVFGSLSLEIQRSIANDNDWLLAVKFWSICFSSSSASVFTTKSPWMKCFDIVEPPLYDSLDPARWWGCQESLFSGLGYTMT